MNAVHYGKQGVKREDIPWDVDAGTTSRGAGTGPAVAAVAAVVAAGTGTKGRAADAAIGKAAVKSTISGTACGSGWTGSTTAWTGSTTAWTGSKGKDGRRASGLTTPSAA